MVLCQAPQRDEKGRIKMRVGFPGRQFSVKCRNQARWRLFHLPNSRYFKAKGRPFCDEHVPMFTENEYGQRGWSLTEVEPLVCDARENLTTGFMFCIAEKHDGDNHDWRWV